MDTLEAFLLGLLQGLTEFLPISSSGHLAIGKTLLGLDPAIVNSPTFEVVVHAATVFSIIVVFRKDIWQLLQGLFKFSWNPETQYITKIVISMIPIAVVGFAFKDQVEELFGSGLLLVGCMLLVTALLLTLTHFYKPKKERSISYMDALVIGISQACAILPGLSRSGTTIATSLLLGDKKAEAAKFSFLMVLIPILGEAFLELIKGDLSADASGIGTLPLVVGFLTAFVVGIAACKFMVELVKRSSLIWFAVYCAIVGVITIIFC
jgi:undecaprenyl-diphosphatase